MSCERWVQLPFILFTLTTTTTFFPLLATSQYETYVCNNNNGNYSSESLYRANLYALLHSLSSSIGNNGFYNGSEGQANAVALCRGDVQLSECRGCVGIVSDEILGFCPNQLEAIRWSNYCMARYSNESIFGTLANNGPVRLLFNSANVTSPDRFKEVRGELFDEIEVEAANGGSGSSLRKAAAGNVTAPDFQTIFAMVQCTPDLSPEDCTSCLVGAVVYIPGCCDNARGVRVYTPNCIVRYESAPFYNITRLQEPLLQGAPSPADSPLAGNNDGNRSRNIVIIVISVVVCLTLILALPVGIYVRKRMKQKTLEIPQIDDEISTVESIQYDFGKIRAATNDFSDSNKLGQGGFGAVYKGKLENGREIAVKRLSRDSGQGNLEFKNEVLLVARLQHRNLVRLLGFSIEGTERLLIYEFVPNGSLDHFIYDPARSSNLYWDKRQKIIGGIARGLLYLHEDSRLRIIHRDLKPGNVLLDEEMNPKISDFGLAKLVVPDETHESTSMIVGTYGYMAPEYAIQGQYSVKSDVYSFGVLVLEILSGQRKIFLQNGENSGDLLSYAWRNWCAGTTASMIDPVLRANSGTRPDMLRCIHIALLCVQENAANRPTMASVVLMLNSFSLTLPVPSEPGFYVPGSSSGYNSSIQFEPNYNNPKSVLGQSACVSDNDSLITKLYPR